jgi:hypothetical protein
MQKWTLIMTENWCKYVCSTVTDIYTVHILEGFGITFYRSDEMANYKFFLDKLYVIKVYS